MGNRAMYAALAPLFAYPGPDLPALAQSCYEQALSCQSAAVSELAAFAATTAALSRSRLEEIYSATFDLSDACCPYLGYHLFGGSPKRALLMVNLKEAYREVGIEVGRELPDHLCLLLGYLAQSPDEDLAEDLRDIVLVPGLAKIAEALADSQNPYGSLLRGALLSLRSGQPVTAGGGQDA
ncbi:MAG: nitrate reductase molybdenum cofactor assembly chaperone [Chloroflexi bacterium]|nr:nitrate reductase molybdenum cofactor assembly chaperone [Chloroflexota bacterium]MCL5108529.1 nitrate reductase molybdenum cofactor assembly chaperone [Chloroflexota bacterium]